ncbi:MAG: phasin family protein [Saccharofermentanales bacterium]|jgi:polyhydroxyalkanoate synthesis regulator phasin
MSDNLLKKSFDFGLGLAAYSKEKIEEMVEEMVKRGEVANKDARKVADDLIEKGKSSRAEIQQMISNEVNHALKKIGLKDEAARKAELELIVRKQVEAALAARETGVGSSAVEAAATSAFDSAADKTGSISPDPHPDQDTDQHSGM